MEVGAWERPFIFLQLCGQCPTSKDAPLAFGAYTFWRLRLDLLMFML